MSILTVVLCLLVAGLLIGTAVCFGLGYLTMTENTGWELITGGLLLMVVFMLTGAFM